MSIQKGNYIVWLITSILTIIVFSDVALHLNSAMFNVYNDGIKNYFNTLYYIYYDAGNILTGINYPFGEHILFADSMPIFARTLQFLGSYIPWFKTNALGIMNFTLLFSIPLSAHFIYKILKHFSVSTILAIIASVVIAFMSPQINRMFAHYGMSLTFYIPLVLYYIINFIAKNEYKNLIYIFITTVIVSLFHLYNLAIISIFLCFVGLSNIVINRNVSLKKRTVQFFAVGLTVVLSYLPSFIYLKLTDLAKNRPSYPYDSLANPTTLSDVLTNDVPLGHIFQFISGNATPVVSTEGKSYLGLISLLLLLFAIASFVYFYFKKIKNPFLNSLKYYNYLLLAGLLQLLFSMAIPFIFNIDFFLDKISLFRHFRAMGRFVWPFYYVFIIYATLLCNSILKYLLSKNKIIIAKSFAASILIITFIQLFGYLKVYKDYTAGAKINFNSVFDIKSNWNDWLLSKNINPNDYQAVIGLPFFHLGSEKIWILDDNFIPFEFALCKFAFQTKLPIVNSLSARISWNQTFEIIEMVDGKLNSKPVIDRFKDQNIIIMVDKTIPLKQNEKEWLEQAIYIGDIEKEFSVYSINPKTLQQNDINFRNKIEKQVKFLPKNDGLIDSFSNAFYYFNSFNKANDDKGFMDNGIFMPSKASGDIVDSITIPPHSNTLHYNLSIWVKCNMVDFRTPYFEIIQFDANNQQLALSDFKTKESTNVKNDWFKAETQFEIKPTTTYIILKAISGNKICYFGLDNLLLQPSESIHYYKTESKILLNNRP